MGHRVLGFAMLIAAALMGAPSAGAATAVQCAAGDDTAAIQAAINYASTHPEGATGRSGAAQGVVMIAYPNTCQIFGVQVKSNVRVVVGSGVVFTQFGNQRGNLFLLAGTNSSLVVGDTSRNAGHWTINADAQATGGNPDIHPINLTGTYLDLAGPKLIGNQGEASTPADQSKFKTTSGMIHYAGASHVWLSNAVGRAQPAGYGLTEVNNGSSLTFSGLTSYGGVALRLETNPCKTSQGISDVTASGITGVDGLEAVDLSAHNLAVTNVQVTNVHSTSDARGVHITNAGGVCENGGGTVTGSVSGGCIVGGSTAQLISGNDTWTVGESITAIDKAGPAPAKLAVTVSGVGASGTFSNGPGPYVDPAVAC